MLARLDRGDADAAITALTATSAALERCQPDSDAIEPGCPRERAAHSGSGNDSGHRKARGRLDVECSRERTWSSRVLLTRSGRVAMVQIALRPGFVDRRTRRGR